MEKTKKTRKVVAAVSAVALSAAIILTGTFAWQSINQEAKNEVQGAGINPGGRLHDDFNGETKKVYVENFGEEIIFARVRLDEYLELGDGAGLKTGDEGFDGKTATPLVADTDINDPSTWTPHKPGDTIEECNTAEPGFHDYFKWTLGGKTVYMPTFDKNKDSLDADVNGTLDGGSTGKPYGDYIEYQAGDKETGNAVYDADDNTIQDENITSQREEHTAVETPEATVITMQDWIDNGRQQGNFWVYDVDGWAYWANPITPGQATGLLLASIEQIAEPDEDWYYSINAVGQFATAGDWGSADDQTGFYDTTKGTAPTANAEILLNQLAGLIDVTVTEETSAAVVEPNNTYTFSAAAKIAGTEQVLADKTFTWSVTGRDDAEIKSTIDEQGVLTVSAEDDLKYLVITAAVDGSTSYGTYTVQVVDPETPVVSSNAAQP